MNWRNTKERIYQSNLRNVTYKRQWCGVKRKSSRQVGGRALRGENRHKPFRILSIRGAADMSSSRWSMEVNFPLDLVIIEQFFGLEHHDLCLHCSAGHKMNCCGWRWGFCYYSECLSWCGYDDTFLAGFVCAGDFCIPSRRSRTTTFCSSIECAQRDRKMRGGNGCKQFICKCVVCQHEFLAKCKVALITFATACRWFICAHRNKHPWKMSLM